MKPAQNLVRETGLEPVREYHTPLKRARLPIPPLSHIHRSSGAATVKIISKTAMPVNTLGQNFSEKFTALHWQYDQLWLLPDPKLPSIRIGV